MTALATMLNMIYTLKEDNTGKITTFSIVQVAEVISSHTMEKEGFIRCLKTLEDNEVEINRITTDQHTSDKDHIWDLKPFSHLCDFKSQTILSITFVYI